MTVASTKGPKGKADRLFGQLVRARGRCERCGVTNSTLQTAHIWRRSFIRTRTLEDNAWCLCGTCHWETEADKSEFMALVEATIGMERYHELGRIARNTEGQRFDWETEVARLKALS